VGWPGPPGVDVARRGVAGAEHVAGDDGDAGRGGGRGLQKIASRDRFAGPFVGARDVAHDVLMRRVPPDQIPRLQLQSYYCGTAAEGAALQSTHSSVEGGASD
jgi:hypothetical protein